MPNKILSEQELKFLVHDLTGEDNIYGITANGDQSQVQARITVDGMPYLYTFEWIEAEGKYKLTGAQPLGQTKL